MKKTLLITGALLAVFNCPTMAQAWNGSSVSTVTDYNVGIRTGGYPSDAALRIDGSTVVSGTVGSSSAVPEFKIHRFTEPGAASSPSPNHLEIWQQEFLPAISGGGTFLTPVLKDVVNSNGWLGVLTANPTEPLHVEGNARLSGTAWIGTANVTLDLSTGQNVNVGNSLYVRGGLMDMSHAGGATNNIIAGSTNGWLGICSGNGGGSAADGGYLQMFGNSSVGDGGVYVVSSGTSASGTTFFYQPNGGTSVANMRIGNDGKVVIGKEIMGATPGDYNLYVSKGILTEKLKVANRTDGINWADFVFDHDYELMPLNKVEAYVKNNKHLPEIPSAKEVAANGIDIAEMDAKLLQKIEELTLYVIQQQKQIDELRKSRK